MSDHVKPKLSDERLAGIERWVNHAGDLVAEGEFHTVVMDVYHAHTSDLIGEVRRLRAEAAQYRPIGWAAMYPDRRLTAVGSRERAEAMAAAWRHASIPVEVFVRDPLPPSGEDGEPT